MKSVAITGASGFVGQALYKILDKKGFSVYPIRRSSLKDEAQLTDIVENSDIIVNLAGASIIKRWSESYKKTLYTSRIDTTNALSQAIQNAIKKPELFISTSAVGIYKNDKVYDEYTTDLADDFLANLCKEWEHSALKVQESGVRTAIFRFGIVLGDGGALKQMLTPFKLGLGGIIGSGKQAFSFIHLEDLLRAYLHVIENEKCEGVFNLTAPEPTTNLGLTKTLGKVLHRPTIFPVPEFVLKLIFSEGAKVLSDGQSAVPKRLEESGFKFEFTNIEEAIEDLV